jgi:hypothetical protein
MGKYKFNPISSDFDMTGSSGASVVDGEVATPADLPITLGTPDVGSVYLALSSSGVWLVNYKPSGLYKRVANDGDADDWSYLGAFDGKFNNDVEITDSTKGLILTNGTNRVRLTLGADNQLVRTVLPLLLACGMAFSASAQIARDLGLDASNRVVTGITNGNPVTFTNPLAFGTNAATTRDNLGLGETNAPSFASVYAGSLFEGAGGSGINLIDSAFVAPGGVEVFAWTTNQLLIYQPIDFGTNAATTISNLFSGGNSLPSGAAAAGAALQANGSGGSVFVASRTVARILTNDISKSNWPNNTFTTGTNAEAAFGTWSLDANSTYEVTWSVGYNYATNAVGPAHGILTSGNLYLQTNSSIGWVANPTVGIAGITPSSLTVIQWTWATNATGTRFSAGTIRVPTGTNSITAQFHWTPVSSNASPLTLLRGSTISVTKIAP